MTLCLPPGRVSASRRDRFWNQARPRVSGQQLPTRHCGPTLALVQLRQAGFDKSGGGSSSRQPPAVSRGRIRVSLNARNERSTASASKSHGASGFISRAEELSRAARTSTTQECSPAARPRRRRGSARPRRARGGRARRRRRGPHRSRSRSPHRGRASGARIASSPSPRRRATKGARGSGSTSPSPRRRRRGATTSRRRRRRARRTGRPRRPLVARTSWTTRTTPEGS